MEWILRIPDKQWILSAEFWQSRPLSRPHKERTHPHAAWDIAPSSGAVDIEAQRLVSGRAPGIFAPESGRVAYFMATRPDTTRPMTDFGSALNSKQFFDLKNHPYFYDIYGGVIILRGASGYTHIFTHSYANQLFNTLWDFWRKEQPALGHEGRTLTESPKFERFPLHAIHNFTVPFDVKTGDLIGLIGNAGFSTGAHIHYEIHSNGVWQEHLKRIDPAKLYPDIWNRHQNDHRRFYRFEDDRKRWGGG